MLLASYVCVVILRPMTSNGANALDCKTFTGLRPGGAGSVVVSGTPGQALMCLNVRNVASWGSAGRPPLAEGITGKDRPAASVFADGGGAILHDG